MKIVVVGYGKMFSNLILGTLESGHRVVGVMRADRLKYPAWFLFIKDIFAASADYSFLKSLKLHEINANSVNSEKFRKEILKLNPDVILVGSWGEKFSKAAINLPKIACINTHPSLLPRYRGPNPYTRTIMNGETESGVTFHIMNEKYDDGPILLQKRVEILQGFDGDTGETLKNKTCNLAKSAVCELFSSMDSEIIIPMPQNEAEATYYPQINESDILIDFSRSAEKINRFIRALTPWQSAYFAYKNEFFKVRDHEVSENNTEYKTPGTIVNKDKKTISVLTGDNKIVKFKSPQLFGGLKKYITRFYIKFVVKTGDIAG